MFSFSVTKIDVSIQLIQLHVSINRDFRSTYYNVEQELRCQ